MKNILILILFYYSPSFAEPLPLAKVNFELQKISAISLSQQCATAADDLSLYIQLQQQGIDAVDDYSGKLLSLINSWNTSFAQIDGRSLIPVGYFNPISQLSINLNKAAEVLEANKLLLDDTLYAITELVASCNFAEELAPALDELNFAARDAETTFIEGVLDFTSLNLLKRNDQLKKLESRNAVVPFEVKSYFLNLASDAMGSSGLGEARWLFAQIFANYQKRAQSILQSLKPSVATAKISH